MTPEPTRRVRCQTRAELRLAAEQIYGGRCSVCGVGGRLEFDHIDNDGKQHRDLEGVTAMLRRIVESGAPIDDYRLQLLCPWHHFCKTSPKQARQELKGIVFQLVHRTGELTAAQYDQIMAALRTAGRPTE